MADLAGPETVIDVAVWLRYLAKEVRDAGDAPMVLLRYDGVSTDALTLADHLWMLGLRLDGRMNDDQEPPAAERFWVSGHPGVHRRDECLHGCEREGCEPVLRAGASGRTTHP